MNTRNTKQMARTKIPSALFVRAKNYYREKGVRPNFQILLLSVQEVLTHLHSKLQYTVCPKIYPYLYCIF